MIIPEQRSIVNRRHLHLPPDFPSWSSSALTAFIGTWRFVILQVAIIISWIAGNSIGFWPHPDPMPYIALNLFLSAEAALATGIILMSQNRSSAIDRKRDDLEAEEVNELHAINKRQLIILELLQRHITEDPC